MTTKIPLRVGIVGPSLDIMGGQAIQRRRLFTMLNAHSRLKVVVLPINPRLPGPLARLQRVKYVRTAATSIAYRLSLLWNTPRVDIVHAF